MYAIGTCCKSIYPSQAKAREAARHVRRNAKSGQAHVYWCKPCQGFHLTTRKDFAFKREHRKVFSVNKKLAS